MKFGRRYKVIIELLGTPDAIVITPPITMKFSINRDASFGINSMSLKLYNLSTKNRNLISKDRFTAAPYTKIIVQAGYENNILSNIFLGNIWEANSYREGVNVITEINAHDGGFDCYTASVSVTINKGKTVKDLVEYLVGTFPNITMGKSGDFGADLELPSPVSLNGNTYGLIKGYTHNNVFIDQEKLYLLQNNEAFTANIPLITADTGMLDTPRRDSTYLSVNMLFEPRVVPGQLIALKSDILPQYDGTYKVQGIVHNGVISETENGKCTSMISLFSPNSIYKKIVTI